MICRREPGGNTESTMCRFLVPQSTFVVCRFYDQGCGWRWVVHAHEGVGRDLCLKLFQNIFKLDIRLTLKAQAFCNARAVRAKAFRKLEIISKLLLTLTKPFQVLVNVR